MGLLLHLMVELLSVLKNWHTAQTFTIPAAYVKLVPYTPPAFWTSPKSDPAPPLVEAPSPE
jgi:hypothetical protein